MIDVFPCLCESDREVQIAIVAIFAVFGLRAFGVTLK